MSRTADGRLYLDCCAEAELTLDLTHTFRGLSIVAAPVTIETLTVVCDDILVSASVLRLLSVYTVWHARDLKELASVHHIRVLARDNASSIYEKIVAHSCTSLCPHTVASFTTLTVPRTQHRLPVREQPPSAIPPPGDTAYLRIVDDALRCSIIEEWQQTLTTNNMRMLPCAVCARRVFAQDVQIVSPERVDLSLLRNDALPPAVRPTTYAFQQYSCAILYPKGMTDPWRLAPFNVCSACARDLVCKNTMPRLCLANWLYYGHDQLPSAVSVAVQNSTPIDRLLTARARASRICFRFKHTATQPAPQPDEPLPSKQSHHNTYPPQGYIRGNVLVMPHNSTALAQVLPPPPAVIRDTVCAVFVGQARPTRDTIGKLRPLLARKSVVFTFLQFLIANNPYYAVNRDDFLGFSSSNMDALFGPETQQQEEGVPCALAIGFLRDNDAVQGSTTDYTHRNEDIFPPSDQPNGELLLMENVGYTCGDESPVSYRQMKMRALSHCLQGGKFIYSRAGESFVPDFANPALLTWLFPHLDPWGIGSFHHPHRLKPITMEEQLRYLLELDDPRFERDPDFAFVYYNILQKKSVCDTIRFRVKASQQRMIVQQLLSLDKDLLAGTLKKFEHNLSYQPSSEDELALLALVDRVSATLHHIPGTTGYKLNLRNEIRALVNFHGTPAFFVTLNPSDVHHPLVRLFAGENIVLEDAAAGEELTSWQRHLLVAKHPGACAKFFHTIISQFIDVILRYGKPQNGLFGKCIAYYGTVESQAKGTLHCHMLIWIAGHPNPQQMRDLMVDSDAYREHMFRWLESIIKCELLGTTDVVPEPSGLALPRPLFDETTGPLHPGIRPLPRVVDYSPSQFMEHYSAFVNELVERYNWHEHRDTCWKYLRRGEARTDQNCRMRIDGSTRAVSDLDPETLSIQLRRLHPRIASYNDLIIFLVQANVDVKHIGSGEGAKALIYYITDYITKASLPAHLGLAALMYALDVASSKYGDPSAWTSREDSGALTVLVNSILARTEISHSQVMSYLVGGGDHYTSHRYRLLHYAVFLKTVQRYWGELSDAVDVQSLHWDAASTACSGPETATAGHSELHPPSSIEVDSAIEDDAVPLILTNGSISAVTQQHDYLLRPHSEPFCSMPLYQFVGLTEKLTVAAEARHTESHINPEPASTGRPRGRPREERGTFMPDHPQYETHLLRKRVVWVIPVVLGPRIPRNDRSPEELEDWCRSVLVLFLPWRTPADLKYPQESWTDAYSRHRHTIPSHHRAIIQNMSVLAECRDARDKARWSRHNCSSDPRPTDISESGTGIAPLAEEDDEDEFHLPGLEAGQVATAHLDSPLHPTRPALLDVIDQLISVPARCAVDRCFTHSSPLPPTTSYGVAQHVTITMAAGIVQEHAYMRDLKRKRRPEPVTLATSSHPFTRTFLCPQPSSLAVTSLPPSIGPSSLNFSPSYVPSHPDPDLYGAIAQVVLEFGLHRNIEQLRAFEIVAHNVCFGGQQLLMYIGGVGGTGKSYVVKAILRLFDILGRRHQILVSAPTGAAAILIGGYTIHSLLLLPHKGNVNLQQLAHLWQNVSYLILDEVSMVSAGLMNDISSRLQHAKGASAIAEDIPFGGVHVIFLGDFGQLRPVVGSALYSYKYTNRITTQTAQKPSGVGAVKGAYLWSLVQTVVLLTKNERQRGDGSYSQLLNRIRNGQCRNARHNRTAFDFRTLQTRLLQNFDPEACARFADAPIIVGRKNIRDPLNHRLALLHAASISAEVHIYYSRDKVDREPLTGLEREAVWDMPTSDSDDTLGRLPLFPGMRVMVQENIAFAHNVVNGALGTVRDIRYQEDEPGIRTVSVVYVEIPGAGRLLGQVEDDVIPVFPAPSSFSWIPPSWSPWSSRKSVTVSRLQPPILPAYVYTDYKAQGRSLDTAIVDLDSARSTQGAYVMLSRVRSLDGVAILRPFRASKIETDLSEEVRREFARLQRYHNDTAAAHPTHPQYYADVARHWDWTA